MKTLEMLVFLTDNPENAEGNITPVCMFNGGGGGINTVTPHH